MELLHRVCEEDRPLQSQCSDVNEIELPLYRFFGQLCSVVKESSGDIIVSDDSLPIRKLIGERRGDHPAGIGPLQLTFFFRGFFEPHKWVFPRGAPISNKN